MKTRRYLMVIQPNPKRHRFVSEVVDAWNMLGAYHKIEKKYPKGKVISCGVMERNKIETRV